MYLKTWSVTYSINKRVKKSEELPMTVGYRSEKRVPTMWHIYKNWQITDWGWGWKGESPCLRFVPVQKQLIKLEPDLLGKYGLAGSQLSLLFSCKKKEGVFVVVAIFCFDLKECFSKFLKRKLNPCQSISNFCGYSLLSPPELGISPPFSMHDPSPTPLISGKACK